MKRFLLLLGASIGLGLASLPASAHERVIVDVRVAPPAPHVEVVRVQRPGHVWAPGYYRWAHERYVWVPGRWLPVRQGYAWVPERWERRGHYYRMSRGHWARDHEVVVYEKHRGHKHKHKHYEKVVYVDEYR